MKRERFQPDKEKERVRARTRKRQDESSGSTSESHPLEILHRQVGNRAVQELLGNGDPPANSEIGLQGDDSERKARRVGEVIGGASEAAVPDRPARREISPRGPRQVPGAGRSLPESERSFFEPWFGYDFSNVRIHTDGRADGLARSVNARAYTSGRDIVFRSGAYAPGTSEGKQLLAHELTHVVQQDRAVVTDVIQRQVDIGEVAESFGRGIADIPEDLARGGRRWLESVNVFDPDRLSEIGQENERVMDAIGRVVTDADVLHDMIEQIVADYIDRLPEDVQTRIRGQIERASGNIVGYIAGRIAGTAVVTILVRSGIRRLATRLAVGAASGASGVGIPIGFAVMQGVVDRAAESAERLKAENHRLWARLYDEDVEMLWFLVEPHVDGIRDAIRDELSTQFGVTVPEPTE